MQRTGSIVQRGEIEIERESEERDRERWEKNFKPPFNGEEYFGKEGILKEEYGGRDIGKEGESREIETEDRRGERKNLNFKSIFSVMKKILKKINFYMLVRGV